MDWSDKGPLLEKMAQAIRNAAAEIPVHLRGSNEHVEAARLLILLHVVNEHYQAEDAAAEAAEHPLTVPGVAEDAKPAESPVEPPEVNYDR